MSQEINNDYSIFGTIYHLDFQKIQGKKDPSKTYAKYLVTLEVTKKKEYSRGDAGKGYKTYTELPQFEAFGQDLSNYAVGDPVKINFYLSGKEYKKSDGTKGIFGKNILTYIRHSDLDGGYPSHVGKFSPEVEEKKRDEEVFQPKDPHEKEPEDDLPFVLLALIGLGTLLPTIPF